jgi:hypothetical protein
MKLTTFVPLAFLLISCASAPSSAPQPAATASAPVRAVAPDWTAKTVYAENGTLVFIVTGTDGADQNALVLAAMTAYLNLPTSASSPVAAVREVKKFLARVSALAAVDRWAQDGKIWWKFAVSKSDWDDSRGKLKVLLEVAPEAADPEHTGDDLVRQGKYADAVTAYMNAASAAAAAGKTPQPAKFKSAFAKAQDVLSKLSLTSSTPALTTRIGQPFTAAFEVRVGYGPQGGIPAVGIPVKFTYKSKTDGQIGPSSQTVVSDAQGVSRLTLPIPTFTLRDSLVVTVDTAAWQQVLAATPPDYQAQAAALDAPDRKLLLPYAVESAAKQVPLIVQLADLDDKGGLRRQESTAALIASLQKLGFQASGVQINLSLLKTPKDNVIITAWKFQGKTTGRAVYGTVSLVSATAAAPFTAEVSGTVKVVDLETSKLVYQLKADKTATANDRASAIALAFRQWGADAASTFDSELP